MALLGWSIADDRDVFSIAEMVEAFDVHRVNPNPARFDLKKCEAINGDHIRLLSPEELVERLVPYFVEAELFGIDGPTAEQQALLVAAAPLVHERMALLTEAVDMLRFLFVDEGEFVLDQDDQAKMLDASGLGVAHAAREAIAAVQEWTTQNIESALRSALIEDLGLKPRVAFGPVRVAVTGSRISPPLFESIELLGRERALARLDRALA